MAYVHSWYISTIPKPKESTSNVNQTKQGYLLFIMPDINSNNNGRTLSTSYLQCVFDFDNTQWFYAYQRRRQIVRNFLKGQLKKQIYELPAEGHAGLILFDVNSWYALMLDGKEDRLWSVQHNVFSKRNKHYSAELVWKKLAISLPPSLFNCRDNILYGYGIRRFAVATVVLMTYNDVKTIAPGDPIVNMDELEAQYIRETKVKASDTSSNSTPSDKQEKDRRNAILVWPNAGNSSSNIIYLGHGYQNKRIEKCSYLFEVYNGWILLKAIHTQYPYT
ncbi:hypothetical protein BDF19DRAFT_117601 [Syncephalis fuscata]|nr:hypothetical protein BDF19DRAFT_117601 [Syncephalis fuscata]